MVKNLRHIFALFLGPSVPPAEWDKKVKLLHGTCESGPKSPRGHWCLSVCLSDPGADRAVAQLAGSGGGLLKVAALQRPWGPRAPKKLCPARRKKLRPENLATVPGPGKRSSENIWEVTHLGSRLINLG